MAGPRHKAPPYRGDWASGAQSSGLLPAGVLQTPPDQAAHHPGSAGEALLHLRQRSRAHDLRTQLAGVCRHHPPTGAVLDWGEHDLTAPRSVRPILRWWSSAALETTICSRWATIWASARRGRVPRSRQDHDNEAEARCREVAKPRPKPEQAKLWRRRESNPRPKPLSHCIYVCSSCFYVFRSPGTERARTTARFYLRGGSDYLLSSALTHGRTRDYPGQDTPMWYPWQQTTRTAGRVFRLRRKRRSCCCWQLMFCKAF